MKKFLLSAMTALISIVLLAGCPNPGVETVYRVETVSPFPLEELAEDLVGSVWAGETPRAGDWLTITFKADNIVIMSFAYDNTTNSWEYTFNSAENKGTITNTNPYPYNWNPAPNGFTISGNVLTITNYGFHGGAPRNFHRLR